MRPRSETVNDVSPLHLRVYELIVDTSVNISSAQDGLSALERASIKRKTSWTTNNPTSSRSHCILTLIQESDQSSAKLTFIDLAGLESGQVVGSAHKETTWFINESLGGLREFLRSGFRSKKVRFVGFSFSLVLCVADTFPRA